MSDGSDRPPDAPPPKFEVRSKGQSLVEAFRAARIARRPALRTELRDNRLALRQERTHRLRGLVETDKVDEASPAASDQRAQSGLADAPPSRDDSASIFAGYCCAVTEASSQIETVESAEPAAPQANDAPGTAMPEVALPLSVIGFGPGMTMRMSQLGIETVSQLAMADRNWLRTELGDLSQLVHVDVWIEAARKACARGPGREPSSTLPGTAAPGSVRQNTG
jgi:predicted flap endonuclease-1-like 5' DNA nuclease